MVANESVSVTLVSLHRPEIGPLRMSTEQMFITYTRVSGLLEEQITWTARERMERQAV